MVELNEILTALTREAKVKRQKSSPLEEEICGIDYLLSQYKQPP